MIIRLFRENQIFTLLFTFLISSLTIFLSAKFQPFTPDINSLYLRSAFQFFPGLKLINNNQFLSVFLNILLTLVCGYYLSRITTEYAIINIRSSLPMFVFLILALPFYSKYQGFSFELLTLLPLLAVIDMLFANLDQKGIAYRFFDSALLISLASLLNPYIIFLIPLILIIWVQNRNFRWQEFLFILYGTVLPYLFFVTYLFLSDEPMGPLFESFRNVGNIRTVYNLRPPHYYLIGFTGYLILASSFQIIRNYVKMKIIIRKYSMIFLLVFLSILLIGILYPFIGRDIIFFLAMPLAFLFSYYFSVCKITIFNQLLFLALTIGHIVIVFL